MKTIAMVLASAVVMVLAADGASAAAKKHHVSQHHVTRHRVAHAPKRDPEGWYKVPDPKPGDPRGWHNGVCSYDCDDAESPGSGYRCRHITMFGSNWRECVKP